MQQDKPLPDSSASKDGITKPSLGGASMADLDQGFSDVPNMDNAPSVTPDRLNGGFLGRPGGWER